MARTFTRASSQYLSLSSALLTAPPFTVSAWVKHNVSTGVNTIFSIGSNQWGDNFSLYIEAGGSPTPRLKAATFRGSPAVADTAVQISSGTWHHCLAIFAAVNDRRCRLNGANEATNGTSLAVDDADRTAIAATLTSAGFDFFNGDIAEVAVWNVVLTDAEILALARRTPAVLIRPGALKGYWPIFGTASPEVDHSGAVKQLTLNGSPAVAGHAPVSTPRFWVGWAPSAAAAPVDLAIGGMSTAQAATLLEVLKDLTVGASAGALAAVAAEVERQLAVGAQAVAQAACALQVTSELNFAAGAMAAGQGSVGLQVTRQPAVGGTATGQAGAGLLVSKPLAVGGMAAPQGACGLTAFIHEGVLVNDDAVNGNDLEAILVANVPAGHQLILDDDGSLTYTPLADFTGIVTFTYKARDSVTGEESSPATVTLYVYPELDIRGMAQALGSVQLERPGIVAVGAMATAQAGVGLEVGRELSIGGLGAGTGSVVLATVQALRIGALVEAQAGVAVEAVRALAVGALGVPQAASGVAVERRIAVGAHALAAGSLTLPGPFVAGVRLVWILDSLG